VPPGETTVLRTASQGSSPIRLRRAHAWGIRLARGILLGALAVALSACATATRERQPSIAEVVRAITPTPSPTTPADAPDRRDLKAVVISAQARLALVPSYRARVIDEAGRTQAVFEYVRPDRYRQITAAKEQIAIGDVTYTRVNNGAWQRQEFPGIGRLGNEVTVAPEFIWDVEALGREAIEGVVCNQYLVVLRIGETELQDRYWIGVEDRLPRKMITQVDTQTTVIRLLYDFNAPITIEPPQEESVSDTITPSATRGQP
jgi:hypothetical protein